MRKPARICLETLAAVGIIALGIGIISPKSTHVENKYHLTITIEEDGQKQFLFENPAGNVIYDSTQDYYGTDPNVEINVNDYKKQELSKSYIATTNAPSH